jgi:hypothetical protein
MTAGAFAGKLGLDMVWIFSFAKITCMATGTIVREPCPLRLFALNMAGLAIQGTVRPLQGKAAVKMECI